MNCKPGDLAVMVRSTCGNEGLICTCIRLHPAGTDLIDPMDGPVWEVDRDIPAIWGAPSPFVPDSYLRPIRDNDGEDEMLRIVGKPESVEV